MASSRSDFPPALVDAVALAIARVIAEQNVRHTPALDNLDGIGRASAVHTMAMGMVAMLQGEARAAIRAVDAFGALCDA